MRVFFQTHEGSLGDALYVDGAPRVGDDVCHPLGKFKVLAVMWWMWGPETLSLLVQKVESEVP
jgi:hypothetical protein